MANPARHTRPYSLPHMFNQSFDAETQQIAMMPVGFDGASLQRANADNLAIKITEVGAITYVGSAATGTAEATAKWQCMKIDSSSGVVITYADGNAEFDNVATDLTALTYS